MKMKLKFWSLNKNIYPSVLASFLPLGVTWAAKCGSSLSMPALATKLTVVVLQPKNFYSFRVVGDYWRCDAVQGLKLSAAFLSTFIIKELILTDWHAYWLDYSLLSNKSFLLRQFCTFKLTFFNDLFSSLSVSWHRCTAMTIMLQFLIT